MDEKIKEKILNYLENTKDFVLDQAPDIIQQALRYHYINALFGIITCFFILVILISVSYYSYSHPKLTQYGSWETSTFVFCFFPFIVCIPIFGAFLCDIDKFIKITTAPKYFLITLFK